MEQKLISEKYKLTCWLINRFDASRSSISSRAAIVLSADAILLTSNVLAIGQIVNSYQSFCSLEIFFVFLFIIASLFFLFSSLIFSTTAIANVWKSSINMFELDVSKAERLFYHPSATFLKYDNFNEFKDDFFESTEKDHLNYALAEYYTVIKTHHIRYQKLRYAIKFTIYSLFSILLLAVTILCNIIL